MRTLKFFLALLSASTMAFAAEEPPADPYFTDTADISEGESAFFTGQIASKKENPWKRQEKVGNVQISYEVEKPDVIEEMKEELEISKKDDHSHKKHKGDSGSVHLSVEWPQTN